MEEKRDVEERAKKLCRECGAEKVLEEFGKDKYKKSGLNSRCRDCINKNKKEWSKKNPSRAKEISKKHYYSNRDIILQKRKTEEHRIKARLCLKKRKLKNLENMSSIKDKKTCCRCKKDKLMCEFVVDFYNRDGHTYECKKCRSKLGKIYRSKEKSKDRKRKYDLKRYHSSITNRLRCNVSRIIWRALKENKKNCSILKYLPYTIEQLKEHLQSQFEDWMSWNNWSIYRLGGPRTWQIDHIKPKSMFKYETMDCEEFRQCWSLENLRPLDAVENIRKGNKIID